MKSINTEPVRFIVTGGLNTLFSYFLYLLLVLLMPYKIAYTASFIVAVIVSYTMNTFFVFRQPWRWKKLLQFPAVYLVQYITGLFLLALLIDRFNVDKKTAPLINVVLLLPLTFLLSKWIVKPRVKI